MQFGGGKGREDKDGEDDVQGGFLNFLGELRSSEVMLEGAHLGWVVLSRASHQVDGILTEITRINHLPAHGPLGAASLAQREQSIPGATAHFPNSQILQVKDLGKLHLQPLAILEEPAGVVCVEGVPFASGLFAVFVELLGGEWLGQVPLGLDGVEDLGLLVGSPGDVVPRVVFPDAIILARV